MSTTDPGATRDDRDGVAAAEDRAARRQNADVAAAGVESNFLLYRMLPQVVFPIGGIVLQTAFIIGSRDPAIAVPCLVGIALMLTSVWLHVKSFRARRAAARAALRGETYDRSGFYHPYLAWLLGLVGFAGPFYFT